MRTEAKARHVELLLLAALAIGAGAATGLIVSAFRFALTTAVRARNAGLASAHHLGPAGAVLVVAGCAGALACAAWLVKRFSTYASGSGVPEVEAALAGELPPAPLRHIVLTKFVGGLLSLGAGAALGPEGPAVQMGAVIARLLATVSGRRWPDVQALVAAGAGAGIAVAFNAPIAGAVFVLEELTRRFEREVALAGLAATSAAILIATALLGDAPELHVAASAHGVTAATWLLAGGLGLVAGALAVLYNRLLIAALAFAAARASWPAEAKAALVGAVVGSIGWLAPGLIGDGNALTQRVLAGAVVTTGIPIVFLVRFGLGALSYAARTPGGLFAPLLSLGALLGALFGNLAQAAFPASTIEPQAFAVVGMAAFFSGVVRAPITGIVLAIEMTAAFTTLVPMLVACFTAMLAAEFLNNARIYDTLRERLIDELRLTAKAGGSGSSQPERTRAASRRTAAR